jgi:penicillin-binding protein 2
VIKGLIEAGRWVELGGATPKPRWSSRLIAAAALVVLLVGGLAVKLGQLQVSEGSFLAGLARANTVHRVVLEADRGIIYDRHGEPLVANSPVWDLEVVPAALPRDAGSRAKELAQLARITGEPEDKLAALLAVADAYGQVRVGSNLDETQYLAINEQLPGLAGVSVAQHAIRTYANPLIFGHVLGYVGPLNDADVQRLRPLGYQPD